MAQPFVDCAIKLKDKIKDPSQIKSITAKVGEGTVHRLWEPSKVKRKNLLLHIQQNFQFPIVLQ